MRRSPARVLVVVVVSLLAILACARGSTTPPAATGTTGPPTAATPAATSTPSGIAVASAPPSTSALPPAASLAAEGGDPVAGQLGSFTWRDGGSDSPWLPGAPIAVGAGEPLTVTLADATPIGAWTAVRAPAEATTGAGAVAAGEGSGTIGFAVEAPGRWTVAVTIAFLAGGSATWYWQLDVT